MRFCRAKKISRKGRRPGKDEILQAAASWQQARKTMNNKGDEAAVLKLAVQLFLKEAQVVTANNAAVFVRRHGKYYQQNKGLGVAKGSGRKPKISIAGAQQLASLLVKGQNITSDKYQPFHSLAQAVELSKEISQMVTAAGYGSHDALWRRLTKVVPTLQRRKLRVVKQLSDDQKAARKQAAESMQKLLAEDPDVLLKSYYFDEATVYVRPDQSDFFIVDGNTTMPYTELEQMLSYNVPKLKYYILVGPRGPAAIYYVTGSDYIPDYPDRPKAFKVNL